MWFGRAHAVRGRMFTWEVLTDFDGDIAAPALEESFRRDFPGMEERPVFWRMVSFNAVDGRRHRFLVAVPDEPLDVRRNVRMLPGTVALYALADREVRDCDCGGNMRFAAVVGGVLFVLVFMEGRLCHWSEERGYGGSRALVEERLERFDTFLKTDPLFSRIEEFEKRLYKDGSDALEVLGSSEAPLGLFDAAARDPFWRRLDLRGGVGFGRGRFRIAGALRKRALGMLALGTVVCVVVLFVGCLLGRVNGGAGESCMDCVQAEAPELEPPLKMLPADSVWSMAAPKATLGPMRPGCGTDGIAVQGTVAGKLAQVRGSDGGARWLAPGDTFGHLSVTAIGRDRVVFSCGGARVELLNGK